MCRRNFRNFDQVDCKIFVFEVKKDVFRAPCLMGFLGLESSYFKTFALSILNLNFFKLKNLDESLEEFYFISFLNSYQIFIL